MGLWRLCCEGNIGCASIPLKDDAAMHKTITTILATAVTSFCLAAHAADADKTNPGATLSQSEAKDLKTQSESQYKARKKVAEANEELNKGDCKTALEGSAKRACERSAKAAAKSHKADAKTVHEAEEAAIKDGKK